MNDLTQYWKDMTDEEMSKTIAAIEQSIQHWQENANAEQPHQVSIGPYDCALCMLVDSEQSGDCDGCPIAAKTGHDLCVATPYANVAEALTEWEWCKDGPSRQAFQQRAQDMVQFLQTLFPEHYQASAAKGFPNG